MEIMEIDNPENNPVEIVTLVLSGERFQADKKKLADYSIYFASLFSENYADHMENEFKINYDITPKTLRNFLNWIDHQDAHRGVYFSRRYLFFVRIPLEYFVDAHYTELMELLELSVVFMADILTDQIVQMIICMRFPPNDMAEIWLLAENLGLKVLRDVALTVCLDRFDEISTEVLTRLPAKNFLKLLLNVNVRSSPERLQEVLDEWKRDNDIPKDLPDFFSRFINGDAAYTRSILRQKKQRYIPCIAANKENVLLGIWSWDGKNLHELAEMTTSQMHTMIEDDDNEMVGYQVVARGFDIYLVGGEQGIGTGKFNMFIWRYSVFSEEWYTVTELPVGRRHMAVAFIKNKLYIFGGVGRYRSKSLNVLIFDIYTATWVEGAKMPEAFTSPPPFCVTKDDKFIYQPSHYYLYDPETDVWRRLDFSPVSGFRDPLISAECQKFGKNLLLIGKRKNEKEGSQTYPIIPVVHPGDAETQLSRLNPPVSAFTHVYPSFEADSKCDFDQQIMSNWNMISFGHSDTLGRTFGYADNYVQPKPEVIIETGELIKAFDGDDASGWKLVLKYSRPKVHNLEVDGITEKAFSQRLGCFNLLDPESLHELLPVPEQESISV